MRTKSSLLILILLFSFTGFSQNKINKNKPKEDIKVNKEYDKYGNLIRYDSTYVYTYSSDSSNHFNPDSSFFNFSDSYEMRKKMEKHFEQFFDRDTSNCKTFHHPFFSDDFFKNDFFDPEFFTQDPNQNNFLEEIEKIMEEQNNFLKEHNGEIHRNLDSLHNYLLKKQEQFLQQKDSINQEYENNKN